MNRPGAAFLPMAVVALAGALGVQLYLARGGLRAVEAEHAWLRAQLAHATAAQQQAGRRAEPPELQREESAVPPATPSEGQIVEALRASLAELERRYPKAGRPPPLADVFGPNFVAERMADPAFARIYRTWYRIRLELEYGDLFVALPVPPTTKDRLIELLLDRQLARMDLIALTGASRHGPDNPPGEAQLAENRRTHEAMQRRFESEIAALLGREAYAQFEAYGRTGPWRWDLAALVERLSYTAHPLSPAQRHELLAQPGGQTILSRGPLKEQAEAQFMGVLSPQQMENLHAFRRMREAMHQENDAVRMGRKRGGQKRRRRLSSRR